MYVYMCIYIHIYAHTLADDYSHVVLFMARDQRPGALVECIRSRGPWDGVLCQRINQQVVNNHRNPTHKCLILLMCGAGVFLHDYH